MSGFPGFIGSEVESVDGTYCFDFSRTFAEAVESGNENNLPVVVICCHCGTARDVSGCGFLFLFFFALLNITQRVLFRIGLKPPTPALVLLRLQVKSRSLNTQ